MPTKIEIDAYKFEELEGKAKARARGWYIDGLTWNWWEYTYESWVEKLAEKGINTNAKQIQFSGFSSQGDGASFTGTLDVPKFMLAHNMVTGGSLLLYAEALEGNVSLKLVRQNPRYSHYSTVRLEHSLDFEYEKDNDYGSFVLVVEIICHGYMKELYLELEQEYEYMCSDEHIVENCASNDYKFNKNGSLI